MSDTKKQDTQIDWEEMFKDEPTPERTCNIDDEECEACGS